MLNIKLDSLEQASGLWKRQGTSGITQTGASGPGFTSVNNTYSKLQHVLILAMDSSGLQTVHIFHTS